MRAAHNPLRGALSYLLFGLLMLLSWLPLWLLYALGWFLVLVLYRVVGYRRRVVERNLASSFPDDFPVRDTMTRFYQFFGELFMETVKSLSISKRNLLRRFCCDNPEIMEEYARQGRSVIFMAGHYGNWEFLICAMNLLFPHKAVGVGKPLSNTVMNTLLNARRARFGMKIIHAGNIRESFADERDQLTASLFLADQYPGGKGKGYPQPFLRKETHFMYGAEKYAREYNFPVVYADLTRQRRGRYSIHLTVLADQPAQTAYGEIISAYVQHMEATILRAPSYWLWSHKRWKDRDHFYAS